MSLEYCRSPILLGVYIRAPDFVSPNPKGPKDPNISGVSWVSMLGIVIKVGSRYYIGTDIDVDMDLDSEIGRFYIRNRNRGFG